MLNFIFLILIIVQYIIVYNMMQQKRLKNVNELILVSIPLTIYLFMITGWTLKILRKFN